MIFKREWRSKVEEITAKGKSADRIEWVDAAKGIAIILMIFGHCISEESVERMCVYSFHMPLFVMISGFFYKDEKLSILLRKSVKGILAPYALVLFLQYTLYIVIRGESCLTVYRKYFYTVLSGISVANVIPFAQADNVGVLWFLPMLFLVRILFWGITKISSKDEKVRMLLVILAAMAGIWTAKRNYWLPWSADIVLFAVSFYYIGFLLQKRGTISALLKKKLCIVLCFAVWGIGLACGITLEFIWRGYQKGFTCIVVAAAGSIVCCAAAYYLCKLSCLKKILSWLGRGSLVILGIHQLEGQFVQYWDMHPGYRLFLVRFTVVFAGYLLFCGGKWIGRKIFQKVDSVRQSDYNKVICNAKDNRRSE